MMSVPAINSVLPPSGSQPAKISTSPTANPSVPPIGLSVPPKLSVIPPPSPTKPPIGVNHSSVPLSLVYENKTPAPQAQPQPPRPPADKPKDLSPPKPTSNGVEASGAKLLPQNQPSSTTAPSNKAEDAAVAKAQSMTTSTTTTATIITTNHSEERFPPSEPPKHQEPAPKENSQAQEKVEQSLSQCAGKEEEEEERSAEVKAMNEEVSNVETKPDKTEAKTLATPKRKREQKPQEKKEEEGEPEKKPRRIRSQVLPYQSPLPELATFISKSLKEKDASQKNNEEKLIVFYKNEFLAVRNAENGFYLCQTLQNVYRSSHRIRIRWLSQKKESSNDEGDIYAPDFYDLTDFECILTTVALNKMDKNMYKLPKVELERIENILKRALDVEKGVTEKPSITEEHPDGIDLSLYKDESQLQKAKKGGKRKASSTSGKMGKQEKKEEGEAKPPAAKKAKGKAGGGRVTRKTSKTSSDKGRTAKRGGGKSESSKPSKAVVDQLKVSPPNEKARVVAKVLRKVDIAPAKEISSKKPAKSKGASKAASKKKKPQRKGRKGGGSGGEAGKEESATTSHHDRRQGKTKYWNSKNKK